MNHTCFRDSIGKGWELLGVAEVKEEMACTLLASVPPPLVLPVMDGIWG